MDRALQSRDRLCRCALAATDSVMGLTPDCVPNLRRKDEMYQKVFDLTISTHVTRRAGAQHSRPH